MMTECYLVAARLDRGIMEYPAPHLGTERAGVRLLSCLENYLSEMSLDKSERYSPALAKFTNRRKIHCRSADILKAHIGGDCDKLKNASDKKQKD